MENGQNQSPKTLPGKKELKNQLTDKMEAALPELRELLGDKKFVNRVSKAAKLLIDGLHKNDIEKKTKQQPKKANAKKDAVKKAPAKKVAPKTAKAAPAKKATAATKKNTGKK